MSSTANGSSPSSSSLIAVAKGLFIGPHTALQEAPAAGITHVLSVVNYEVDPPEGLCHWSVSLEDSEGANLLQALPGAVAWLERAMRQAGSRVLVHCHAGTSRSAAVVVGAIMKAKRLTAHEALAVLRLRAPGVEPNPSFMAQLELWGEMGCGEVDEGHPGYKQFLLSQTAHLYEEQGWVDPETMAALPEDEQQLAQLVRYRCRKCRQLLITQHNVVPQEGVGRRLFRRRHQQPQHEQQQQQQSAGGGGGARSEADGGADAAASSTEQGALFVEPMQWMGQQVVGGATQGKLYCPQCSARLGSFNWAGISNAAGAWMTPGFQLHLSKLDQLSPKPPAALAGMRFPAALAEHRQQQQEQEQQQQQGGQSEPPGHGAGAAAAAPPPPAPAVDFLPDVDVVRCQLEAAA